MKILPVRDFTGVNDPVKTEETIHHQLVERASEIITDYTYTSIPLAWAINTYGLTEVQRVLDQIHQYHANEKLFFVCQHILVDKLNFYNSLVFTPHATLLDSYLPIPHYACNYDLSMIKPWNDRQYEYSFVGSFKTHPVRGQIYELLKDREDCYVEDTGNWHFEGTPENQEKNKKKYIEVLGNTKHSLCPRGTGPSSIRIWESMAMGANPVILSDFLQMPLERELSSTMWLKISENIDNIDNTDLEYNNKEYWDWFSNDNLYKSITTMIKRIK
jgi:hypothetical protein